MELRPLDHHQEGGRAAQAFALHHVLVGEHVAVAVLGGDDHAAGGAHQLAGDLHLHPDTLPQGLLHHAGLLAAGLRGGGEAERDGSEGGEHAVPPHQGRLPLPARRDCRACTS